MRCEECLPLIEDFFDGELDGRTSDLVTRHIDSCPPCAGAYQKLEREHELYLAAECDVQPSTEFWANVRARTAEEKSPPGLLSNLRGRLSDLLGNFGTPRFSPQLTALIVLVAIGITALVMSYVNRRQSPPGPGSISQNTGPRMASPTTGISGGLPQGGRANELLEEGDKGANSQPQSAQNRVAARSGFVSANGKNGIRASHQRTPDELVREAEQKYVAAIAMLSRDVNRRRSRLDPEVADRFEKTLAAVDRTIAETRRAVREHPGDPVAAKYMLMAYSKKLDVLREMASF